MALNVPCANAIVSDLLTLIEFKRLILRLIVIAHYL